VVPGLVSPAQMPRPLTFPFRSAPGPRPPGGRGQTAPLPSLLEGGIGYVPSASSSRGRLPSSFHVSTAACLPESRLLDSIARGEQPPDRFRGGSSYREGGHRGGAAASSSQLHQQHIFSAEEEWEDAPHHQPKETKCSASRDPSLQDGVAPGCAPRHPSWGLCGLHRSEGRLLPRPHRRGSQEVPLLQLERAPLPVLRPPLQSVTRWVPRSGIRLPLGFASGPGGGGGCFILRMRPASRLCFP
jgi:hypothetical protein